VAWKLDFTEPVAQMLPPSPPAWIEEIPTRSVKPIVKCNSVVSVSQNYLYLTTGAGYELVRDRGALPIFLPMKSLLIIVAPPSSGKSQPAISSIIELPDTNEGIITLDKSGTVFCSHASIATSTAYYLAQRMGIGREFRKPIGGVTALAPERL
ncbi:MAG: hypothetical protein K6U11_14820, partial [bacterium]|nr:hypothetical protein [bacterium]